jgi:hypothetical protein
VTEAGPLLAPCDDAELCRVLRDLARRGYGFLGCCPATETLAVMRHRLERASAQVFLALGPRDEAVGVAAFAVSPANPFQATIDVLPTEHSSGTGTDQVRAAVLFGSRFLALTSFLRLGQVRDAAERYFTAAGFEAVGILPGALFCDGAYQDQRVLYQAGVIS